MKAALLLLALADSTRAATRKLFAQEIEYCSSQQIVLVQRFDLAFYPDNSSVSFNIVANSVKNAVDATVSFDVNAYGLSPISYAVDLCSIANGVLCPLPAYQLFVFGSLSL
jgi:hypothetical protein